MCRAIEVSRGGLSTTDSRLMTVRTKRTPEPLCGNMVTNALLRPCDIAGGGFGCSPVVGRNGLKQLSKTIQVSHDS
jgi:hypothetical protein